MAFSAPNPLGQPLRLDVRYVCTNRPFPSSPEPRYQNDVKCSAFDVKMVFHSHANKTHFHKKGCAPSLILKVRVFLELGSGLLCRLEPLLFMLYTKTIWYSVNIA